MPSQSPPDEGPVVLQLRTPGDLVAIVPYLIGFHPSHSLCALALTGNRVPACMRIDLPDDDGEIRAVLSALAVLCDRASTKRKVDAVALVGYGTGPEVTPMMTAAIKWATERGLYLEDAVRVDDERFWSYLCPDPACCPPEGQLVDRAASIVAEAVAQGVLALADREEMAALVAAIKGEQRAGMVTATEAARAWLAGARAEQSARQARLWTYREGNRRIRAAITTYAAEETLSDTDTARLSVLLGDKAVRDAAWVLVNAAEVTIHRALWCDMTRRAVDNVEACASLAAFAGYMAGDGALANLALDRAAAANPDYTMTHLVRQAVAAGMGFAEQWPFQTLEEQAAEQARINGDDPADWLQAIATHDVGTVEEPGAATGDITGIRKRSC